MNNKNLNNKKLNNPGAVLKTRFNEVFSLTHPIVSAPMDLVAGGRLAGAVSRAGGLGLIGGGYGDETWLKQQFAESGNEAVGAGFITWSLQQQPELLDLVLKRRPRALMFSFGDSADMVAQTRAAGVPTLWQVQQCRQAEQALKAGVDVIVVQGQEGGGHGMERGLMTLLPAVRALAGPDQLILAAGGIADGRGLAAALMLGADGALVGTRFWASEEAIGTPQTKQTLVDTKGDDTIRTKVFDVARGRNWPWHFTGRVLNNEFCQTWHENISGLQRNIDQERTKYNASDMDDFSTRVLITGEAIDLIHTIKPAAQIVEEMATQAAQLMRRAPNVHCV